MRRLLEQRGAAYAPTRVDWAEENTPSELDGQTRVPIEPRPAPAGRHLYSISRRFLPFRGTLHLRTAGRVGVRRKQEMPPLRGLRGFRRRRGYKDAAPNGADAG